MTISIEIEASQSTNITEADIDAILTDAVADHMGVSTDNITVTVVDGTAAPAVVVPQSLLSDGAVAGLVLGIVFLGGVIGALALFVVRRKEKVQNVKVATLETELKHAAHQAISLRCQLNEKQKSLVEKECK